MNLERADDAILLTERGGSGTRLLGEIASSVGVFIGNDLNASSDSLECQVAVKEMARQKLSSADGIEAAALERWRRTLRELAAAIRSRGAWAPPGPWGWKLPELMFVLPETRAIFPGARVIHLVRHPVDLSLRRTHGTSRMDNPMGSVALPAAYRALGLDPVLIERHRRYMHNAVAWQHQVSTVVGWARGQLPKDRYLELRYEDVCADTAAAQGAVARFVGGVPESPPPMVDPARMRRYEPSDERISQVWTICGATAGQLGYRFPGDASSDG